MSSKQQLVLSIIDFLNTSIKDGTVKQDDVEALEIASQCIGEAFDVDPTDAAQRTRLSVKPATLPTIFDVFLKTRAKMDTPATPAAAAATPSASTLKVPTAEDKTAAESFKAKGNSHMSTRNYEEAIAAYGKAIELDPTNPVYYSNRAAAHSSTNNHTDAILDAESAIEVEPTFVKAYHRLGHAHYSLSDYSAAAAAFRRGLELDPSNASLKSGLQNAESRVVDEDASTTADAPPAAPSGGGGLAEMLRGLGSGALAPGAPPGGGPDLASLMNNPMMMQMAQQMMSNGGLERMMSNPALANMMGRVQSGGGMPSMDELLSDPGLREMASQLGAGAGAGAGGAGRS
ncbi:hypothetical protein EUX98_g4451 [Antrodiella citrinella]|uniref:SGTA homodimerisation domain-containing protein n=1 Tax=Antrodiella citrinella TaxID=2447956 RepID=A0A4V3XIM1_9APHY|nr:hypothetical protein EUX98_g4451 [Antrodiella citrinella]